VALAQPVQFRGEVLPRGIRQARRFAFLGHFAGPFILPR
jgi:hypothetical protein